MAKIITGNGNIFFSYQIIYNHFLAMFVYKKIISKLNYVKISFSGSVTLTQNIVR